MRDLEFSGAGVSEYGGGGISSSFFCLHQVESSGMRAVCCALLECVLDYYTTLPYLRWMLTQFSSRNNLCCIIFTLSLWSCFDTICSKKRYI